MDLLFRLFIFLFDIILHHKSLIQSSNVFINFFFLNFIFGISNSKRYKGINKKTNWQSFSPPLLNYVFVPWRILKLLISLQNVQILKSLQKFSVVFYGDNFSRFYSWFLGNRVAKKLWILKTRNAKTKLNWQLN